MAALCPTVCSWTGSYGRGVKGNVRQHPRITAHGPHSTDVAWATLMRSGGRLPSLLCMAVHAQELQLKTTGRRIAIHFTFVSFASLVREPLVRGTKLTCYSRYTNGHDHAGMNSAFNQSFDTQYIAT